MTDPTAYTARSADSAHSADSVLARLAAFRVVPIVVIDDAAAAPELAGALIDGGLPCAEVTLRTPAGLDAIARIAALSASGDFLVGAGTVLTAEEVDRCVDAGARFIVSPGYDDDVVNRCQQLGIAVIPGVATATEVQRALRAGLDVLKLFPANTLGGPAAISALAGPFPDTRFMASGGITLANALDYLDLPSVSAVGASWIASRQRLLARDFEAVRTASAEAVAQLQNAGASQ